MIGAAILIATLFPACGPGEPLESQFMVELFERTFVADLPPDFKICRSGVGVDDVVFNVRKADQIFLLVWVGQWPYGGGRSGEHIPPQPDSIVRTSADGNIETLVTTSGGRERVRQRMFKTTDDDRGTLYVIVEVPEDLAADRAAVAATLIDTFQVR